MPEDTKQESTAIVASTASLDVEAVSIINQVIAENDAVKTRELTELFNLNQKKKTMARVNKLNNLLDIITDQAIERFSKKPDEISNQELLQGLKVVQDIAERGQKQLTETPDQPIIQINQQNNEVNVGDTTNLSRDSRDKVKNAVASLLAGLAAKQAMQNSQDEEIINVEQGDNNEN